MLNIVYRAEQGSSQRHQHLHHQSRRILFSDKSAFLDLEGGTWGGALLSRKLYQVSKALYLSRNLETSALFYQYIVSVWHHHVQAHRPKDTTNITLSRGGYLSRCHGSTS